MTTTLPPGRELDALIAIKVMGWARLGSLANSFAVKDVAWAFGARWCSQCPNPKSVYRITPESATLWAPSTDIAAAWLVFQEMRGRLFSTRTRFFAELGAILQHPPALKSGLGVAWPDAMMYLTPHAICLAALAAVEERS